MPLKKPVPAGEAAEVQSDPAASLEFFAGLCPTLWAYLSDKRWEDGSARTTATMTMFVEDGQVKLCLNDRDGGRTAWSTSSSLEGAAYGLEDRLCKGTLDWRPAKQWGKGGKNKS